MSSQKASLRREEGSGVAPLTMAKQNPEDFPALFDARCQPVVLIYGIGFNHP